MKHRFLSAFSICFYIFFSTAASAQLVTDNAFLQGRWLEVAIAPNGAWGNTITVPATYHTRAGAFASYTDPVTGTTASGNAMDFSYDFGHDGWAVGTDPWYGPYFLPGTPFDGWSMQVGGVMSSAFYSSSGFAGLPGSTLTGTVNAYNYIPGNTCLHKNGSMAGVWAGSAGVGGALKMTQTYTLDTNASWLNVTMKFVNTSGAVMPDVYYFVTADPDNDEVLSLGSFPTNNHIAYQGDFYNRHEVWARPPSLRQDAFSGLCSKDCRSKALIYQSWPPSMVAGNSLDLVWAGTATSMGTIYTAPQSTTFSQDIAYGLIFNLGNIAPGDSTILAFAWIFSDSDAIDSAFPGPKLVTEGLVRDSLDTVSVCTMTGCGVSGLTFTADVINGDDKDWSMANWTWAPSTGLSATTGTHVTVNTVGLSGPTTFTITGTKDVAHGQCGTKTMYLYVIPCFSATSNSPGPALANMICIYDTLKLVAHGDSTDATYLWYGPGGYTATDQASIRTGMSMGDTGIYTVVRTHAGLNDTATTRVLLKPKPVVNATTNAPICSGNLLTLTVAPDSVGETFRWTGPTGFTSTLVNPIRPGAPVSASGVYKVIANWNGCIDSATVVVIVDTTPARPSIGSNSPICSQNETLLLTSSDVTPGVSYSWGGPAGFTSVLQNPILPGVSTSASGIYTVTVSITADGITCRNSNSTVVTVDSTPYLTVLGSNSPVCSGNALLLTANNLPASDYYWSGPPAFYSTIQNPVINPATTSAAGIYTVYATVTYVIGGPKVCTSAVSYMSVVVDSTPAIPTASSNSPGVPSICQGDTLKLMANNVTAGVTYSWVGPNSFTSTLQNPIIVNVSPAATGSYTVTTSLGNPCVTSAVITVSITPTPPLTATSNSPICTGVEDTLYLQALSDPGATFVWSGPYTFRSTLRNPTRTPVVLEQAGIYHVTATLHNCSATVDDTVVIKHTPAPPRVVSKTYCQFVDAPALQAMGDSILWYTSGTAKRGMGVLVAPKPQTDTVGHRVYFTSQTISGCTSFIDSIHVTINPKPLVKVNPDTAVCPHDTALLRAVDTDLVAYYHWSPKLYLSDTAKATVKVTPLTNANYTVVATNEYGCTDTAMVVVSVFPSAVITLDDSVTLFPGESYQISPQTNCSYFSWFPALGLDNPKISNPKATPEASTLYVVHAKTSWGCLIADSIIVNVNTESDIAVPNAFAPGNGPNSKFKVIKRGIAHLDNFSIFDRWGIKVFETNNIDEGWDGMYNGKPQPQGVYMFQVKGETLTGRKVAKQGNVTLLR